MALILAVGLACHAHAAEADAPELKETIEKLFASAWGPDNVASQKAARVQRERAVRAYSQKLRDMAPDDPRVCFAFMLVALKRDQVEAAGKFYADLPEAVQGNRRVLQCKVWTCLMGGAHADACTAMERLVELLPAEDTPGDAAAEHRDTVTLLGGSCGYLAGPAGALQPEGERRITDRLTATRRAAFDTARAAVLEQFADLAVECRDRREAARAAEQQQRQRDLAELAVRRQGFESQIPQTENRLQEVQRETSSEMGRIDAEQRDLDQEARNLEAGRISLAREFDILAGRIEGLRRAAEDPEVKPHEKQRLLNSAAAFEVQLNRNVEEQHRLQNLRQRLVAEAAQLVRRKTELARCVAVATQRVNDLRTSIVLVGRQEEQLLATPITGNTPEVLALEQRLTSPATYVPFSLDAARDMVLRSLR